MRDLIVATAFVALGIFLGSQVVRFEVPVETGVTHSIEVLNESWDNF